MQTRRALSALALAALAIAAVPAHAATPDDFVCDKKTVVTYHPGPNWAQFSERLAEHLDFVKAKLEQKAMVYGAPVADASGAPVGGLFVYNDTDLDSVEALVQDDTFVKNGVVTFNVVSWGMCQAKPVKN
jgi:uncharacterized protein YciI